MIRIRELSRRFGATRAVDGVSIDIPAGQSVALWGGNGAGKTTLLRCVLGLLRFDGQIRVGGFDVRQRGKCARMLIGYVPQELGFYDDLRVTDAIDYFARLRGVRPACATVLGRVGLDGHGGKRIRELSGGMKQRLALGVAMLGDPPVLVLDEVTASLDIGGREEFVALLKTLSGDGRTLLFASHRAEEVTRLAGRVILMDRGKVVDECDSAAFAGRIGAQTLLHLTLACGQRERAIRVLASGGLVAASNGVGIFVPVPAGEKATPFRLLCAAGIDVADFHIVSSDALADREVPK